MNISVAMATYNGAKYIREQLDSVLCQSIPDFELVICDDCSTDNTFTILQEYADRDPRISVYRNKKNLGFKKNFEKVIQLTKGDFVAMCDQDDVWTNNHLEVLLNGIGDKMISAGNSDLIDGDGKQIGLTLKEMEVLENEANDNQKRAYSLVYFRNPYQGAAMLIKREFFTKALPIPDDIKYHDAWFSMLSCFYGGMNYTDQIVNKYRMHGHNVTGKRIKRKSRVKTIAYQLIYSKGIMDRPAMLRTVVERVDQMTEEQKLFIEEANKVFTRTSTLGGRIKNFFFRVSHYNEIYT